MDWLPKVLVLGPGGIKGFVELGALYVLEQKEFLAQVDRVVGVSVGAIIGLLLVAGYSTEEIMTVATGHDIFHDLGSISLDKISSNAGVISNEPIRSELASLITSKFGHVPSLGELARLTGYRFYAVSLNIDRDQVMYYGPDTAPDMPCVTAVMLSMNIPFLFYRLKHVGETHIDGALGNPYPISYFDDGETNILGLYIQPDYYREDRETVISVRGKTLYTHTEGGPRTEDLPFPAYLHKVIQSSMNQHRKLIMEKASMACRHICLYTSYRDTLGIMATPNDKGNMILDGYRGACEFLSSLSAPEGSVLSSMAQSP